MLTQLRGAPAASTKRAASGIEIDVEHVIVAASRHCEEGRHSEALALLTRSANALTQEPMLMYAQGCTLFAWDRTWEAHQIFSGLFRAGFEQKGLFAMLGWTSLAAADCAAAESWMRKAVAASPDDWESHYGLGVTLRMRDAQVAAREFSRALAANPDNLQCLVSLSACALDRKDAALAEDYARRALRVCGTSAPAWTNLGMAQLMQDRPAEALGALQCGERLADPCDDDLDLNPGIALRLLGRTRDAIEYFEDRLLLHPSIAAAGHYALALLTVGRLREGWTQYEFRWLQTPLSSQRARYDRPAWNGQDVAERTILIRCEQGAGDVFQFIRYAPLLKSLGATVWLQLRPGIGALATVFPGIDRIYPPAERVPDFDFYIDMLSLPRVFGTTLQSIPADVPYLHAPENARARWLDRLSGEPQLTVGLAWAGDPTHARDRQRSISLATVGSLTCLEGTRWFSLQKGSAAEALKNSPSTRAVVDLGPDLYEYADTAAAIEQLDLVITVDTSIAHLAGALGKPVWVLLPFSADWRWMEGRDDSPWYPTMRLFRQRVAGEWDEVIERVRSALSLKLSDRGCGATDDRADEHGPGASASRVEPDVSPTPGIARACRARMGMIQYVGKTESARSIAYYGEYLQPYIDVLRHLVSKGDVVLEIGAGIGLHTMALAPMLNPGGLLLALENSRVLRRMLRQNLAVNEIRCVNVVKGMLAGGVPSQSDNDDINGREAGDIALGAVTIDGLQLERLQLLKVTDPDLVSLTLDGAADTLWRHRPILFLTVDASQNVPELTTRVRDLGYRCWRVEAPLFNPTNFNRRDDDIFAGRAAVAILGIPEEVECDSRIRELASITTVTPL
jgi:Flp pilus assembly protein TadD